MEKPEGSLKSAWSECNWMTKETEGGKERIIERMREKEKDAL